jgi:arylsulfatase A
MYIKHLCTLALAFLWIAGSDAWAQSPAQPNIILFFVDDQGWTGTSVPMDPNMPNSKSDYYRTPNLERLASQGMRFSRAYSAGPNCSPTRASLQTGLSPAQLQFTNLIGGDVANAAVYDEYVGDYLRYPNPVVLDTNAVSIADRLNAAPEYHTGFIHKDHFGATPQDLGYDMVDFHVNGYAPPGEDPAKIFSIANRANAYITQQVQADRPFFLQINQFAVHTPIVATTESRNLFASLPKGTRHKDTNVAAMTYDLDKSLGMIMDKVEELNIADNTYIIYMSDNGGVTSPLNNDPLSFGKGHLLEGGIRVPLVVSGPGINANSHSSVPVITTDLFATVTDLAGVTTPLPAKSESASWRPLFENGGQMPANDSLHRAFGENGELFFHYPHGNVTSAVIDGDYKLVRLYATSASSQQRSLLFNLANNTAESYDVNSPLNLASQLPAKTAELNAKLDRWLDGVDASMALPWNTPIHLEWSADDFGGETGRWRSHLRVGNYRNETLQFLTKTYQPVATDIHTFQPGLPDKGINPMQGGGLGNWTFIASDNTFDTDNSATFDMWIKLDSMDRNQLVFETGTPTQGLSFSVGDADANGVHNDLRFRITTASGQTYVVTAPLDANANPLRDMVQVTGVVKDSGTRSISLYINGALVGTDDGTNDGATPIDWDNYQNAFLGIAVGNSIIGGSAGTLQPAFTSANFNGKLATFGFRDRALSAVEVRDGYNAVLDPVTAGLAQVSGLVDAPAYRPSNTVVGAFESATNEAVVIQERSDVLAAPVTVNLTASAGSFGSGMQTATPGQLAAGTQFTSYLLHFDPASTSAETTASGSITFQQQVLGVIFEGQTLDATNGRLGSIGIYPDGQETLNLAGSDWLQLSTDLKTLTFNMSVNMGSALQLRILTEQAVVLDGIPGDYNYDGVVNLADYNVWRDSLGSDGFNLAADGNGDNIVNGTDYEIWKSHFGTSTPQAEAQSPASVPEPSTLVATLLLMSLAFAWQRSRR